MDNHRLGKNIILGAAAGLVVGGIAALLSSPSSGEKIRQQLKSLYNEIEGQAEDLLGGASKKGKSIVDECAEWCHSCKVPVSKLAKQSKKECGCRYQELLIGGALGAIFGAVAGLTLAPKAGTEIRADISETYEEASAKAHELFEEAQAKGKNFARQVYKGSNKWLNLARQLATDLVSEAGEKGEELTEQSRDRFEELIQWAALGFKVLQKLTKR